MNMIKNSFLFRLLTLAVLVSSIPIAFAQNYPLPPTGHNLIGQVQSIYASDSDTPTTLAQRYNLGLNAVIAANPGTTEQTVGNGYVKIPTEFLLPPLPHRGIIVNLPEMRMYYYPENSNDVMSFPIGIGKIGKTIPIENTVITRKVVNPIWTPPKDIREFNRAQGIELPDHIPPGPDNPLGVRRPD